MISASVAATKLPSRLSRNDGVQFFTEKMTAINKQIVVIIHKKAIVYLLSLFDAQKSLKSQDNQDKEQHCG